MHRSGTSFAARALEALGVSFGNPALLMQPGPDNVAGYWENRAIKELDNDLLTHFGGSWDSPPVLDTGWTDEPSLEEFRVRAVEALDAAFGPEASRPLVGWKDPRLSILLPFWRTITPITATVILVRDPMEVAASLGKRDRIRPPQACLLWLRYLLAAIENDPENHLILDYGAFFEDPRRPLVAMADHLSLPNPDDRVVRDITAHFDPALRHHVAAGGGGNEENENPIVQLASSVWNAGDLTVAGLDPTIARAIAHGWLRPPVDTEAFDRTRARNIDLTELFRRRSEKRTREINAQIERDPNHGEP